MRNVKNVLRRLENQVEEMNEENVVEEVKEQISESDFLQMVLQEMNNKTFHLTGSFDEDLLRRFNEFASNLYFYENDPNPTVEIRISSRGGQVDILLAMLSVVERIREMWDCKIHCHIDGYSFSCGALFFLIASDIRTMGTQSQMMMHEVSWGYNGKLNEHKSEVAYTEKLQKRIDKMIIENTPITRRMLNKWYKLGDVYFFKEDLEKLGVLTMEEEENESNE